MHKMQNKYKIFLLPIILIFTAVVIIYYGHYANTIEIIVSEYQVKIKLIEQSIYNETKYTEIVSKVAERDRENKMRKSSYTLVEKYKKDARVGP